MKDRDIRDQVREGYARIASGAPGNSGGCCSSSSSCCSGGGSKADELARKFGYSDDELKSLPEGANLGLSCGNPIALASLRPGEVVLDLGSGAGFDALLASQRVGPEGTVIGVDMTPEMISRARANAARLGAENVEFRLGEIENLPVPDGSVDAVISNCVINLSPDKPRVFREIARVLKKGGRVAVSDMALLRPLPEDVLRDIGSYVGCISGAVPVEEYVSHMKAAGLEEISVDPSAGIDAMVDVQDPLYRRVVKDLPAGSAPSDFVASVRVTAIKK